MWSSRVIHQVLRGRVPMILYLAIEPLSILWSPSLSARWLLLAVFVPARTIFLLLLGLVLLQKRQNIEILLIKEDFLLGQALLNNLSLLADRLRAAVDLLEHNLHKCWLKLGEHPHFGNGFVLFMSFNCVRLATIIRGNLTLEVILRGSHPNYDSLRVLVLLLLYLALNLLWIEALEAVSLDLETVVEVCKVVDVVMDCLRSLLFFSQGHLKNISNHSVLHRWVVRVAYLLLDDKRDWLERTV